jgi:hypothetical protein
LYREGEETDVLVVVLIMGKKKKDDRYRQKFLDRLDYVVRHGIDDLQSKQYLLLLRGQYKAGKMGWVPLDCLKKLYDLMEEDDRDKE